MRGYYNLGSPFVSLAAEMNFNQQPFQCGCRKYIHTHKKRDNSYTYARHCYREWMHRTRTPRVITLNIPPYFNPILPTLFSNFPRIFDETCPTCRRTFTEINQSINHPQRLWRKLVCTDSALTSIDGAISRRKWVSFFALKSNCAIRESRVRSIKKLIRNFCIFFASRGDQAHQDTPARIHQVTREKLSIQGDESAFRAATESVNLLYPVRRRGRWSYNFFSRGKTRSPG